MTAKCNRCAAPVVWARWVQRAKWVAIAAGSVRGTEKLVKNDFGHDCPVFMPWHRFHTCLQSPKPKHTEQLAAAYATLFVVDGAPPEVIKAAYRALAALHHPDKGGDVRQMQNINLAFELAMAVRS